MPRLVMKFGGTSVADLDRIRSAAARVKRGGVVLVAPLPTGCKRYLRLAYSGPASGKVTAGLVESPQTSGMR